MKTSKKNNVFSGPDSIVSFLNPEKSPPTPLVELSQKLNPLFAEKVRIFAKLMSHTPLTNIKSYPAFNMLSSAKGNGELDGKTAIIESSSGNTAMSLTIIGSALGVPVTKAIVSNRIAADKLKILRLFGTEVIVNREPMCPDKDDPESGINKAKEWARTYSWFNPGQYDNPGNPGAHEKWTGKQIWEQTDGEITVFAATLGTTGTMTGSSKALKAMNKHIHTVGVASSDDKLRLGPRTKSLLTEIAFNWQEVTDSVVEVTTKQSFFESMKLCRSGMIVGPSSGFNYRGLVDFLLSEKKSGNLDKYRNKNNEVIAVFICSDLPYPYIHEYFEHIEDKEFPMVVNEKLLLDEKRIGSKEQEERKDNTIGIDPKEAFLRIYGKSFSQAMLGESLKMSNKIRVIDIRKQHDFDNFHIADIEHLNYFKIEEQDPILIEDLKKLPLIIFDCGLTGGAERIVEILIKHNIDAVFVNGGMDRWTKEGLPVVRKEK